MCFKAKQDQTHGDFISFIQNQWRAWKTIIDKDHLPLDPVRCAPLPCEVKIVMNLSCLTQSSSTHQSQEQGLRVCHFVELGGVNPILKRKIFSKKAASSKCLPASFINKPC